MFARTPLAYARGSEQSRAQGAPGPKGTGPKGHPADAQLLVTLCLVRIAAGVASSSLH
ncbi:hypothetical protein SBA4_4540005 [Candidatus Sulfopaludibacter sp. SbA4]|nr:hypothetical protein SBA4_4540005 [Candidatus Sulfopaludibacter sp. SbA4]